MCMIRMRERGDGMGMGLAAGLRRQRDIDPAGPMSQPSSDKKIDLQSTFYHNLT